MQKIEKTILQATKRGDTIIEAMFAFAVFSLISIVTVSMMNLGIATSERSLELSTARNELNAQAEALRFIHSSYIAEMTLPECGGSGVGNDCQRFQQVWENLIANAKSSSSQDAASDPMTIEYPLSACSTVYEDSNDLLRTNKAFIINTRKLSTFSGAAKPNDVIISAAAHVDNDSAKPLIFQEATLNARIIYGDSTGDSSESLSSSGLTGYTNIKRVEGIWVVAVKGPTTTTNGSTNPQYYDFFIETCWYGSGNSAPTSLDTVVRLYNPNGV